MRLQLPRRFVIILWLCAIALLSLSACNLVGSEPVPAGPVETGPLPGDAGLAPDSPPDPAQGALVYAEHCASCHGLTGAGDGDFSAQVAQQGGALPDFTNPQLARIRTPQDWYTTITLGNVEQLMPPWESELSDTQRWDLTAYLYSLSASPEVIAQGQTIYESTCAECHGADGAQNGLNDLAAMAALSPQAIYQDYVTSGGDGIHAFVELSEDEAMAVALYTRTFTFGSVVEVAAALTPTATPQVEPTAIPPTPGAENTPGAEVTPGPTPEITAVPPAAEPTAVPANGSVTGVVVNGSPDGADPVGLEVRLSGVTLDTTGTVVEFLSRTTQVAADGSFRFDDVPFDQTESAYVVTVVYQGVEFSAGDLIDPTSPALDLPVTIYETATDPAVITVEAMHLIVDAGPDAIQVVEVLIFSNSSQQVYVSPEPVEGGRRGSVAFSIPPDAYGLSFEEGQLGGRFVAVGSQIYDTTQVLPGANSHTIIASYLLPASGGGREISLPVQYPTNQVTVLTGQDTRIQSGALTDMGVEAIGDQQYRRYSGAGLAAGDTLTFRVGGAASTIDVVRIALSALLGVVVAGGVIYWFVRGRRVMGRGGRALPGDDAASALARQIAALDEQFEAGKINRFDYEVRRAELKAELAELIEAK